MDTVAKNNSTSFYGSIITFNESPLREGLLFAGTDDGLIQVSPDGGASWIKTDRFKGVPDESYVSDIEPSHFDEKVVYASFDNHKRDDFKPYILKSTDQGKSWKSMAGNLPERGTVYTIALDHVDPDLVFVGTEFGVFFTRDEGQHWTQLKAGMPVIACRDLEVQRRENDLVVATFGRGFYVLDDYTPLRGLEPASLEQDALIFPVREALLYTPSTPVGDAGRGHQGDAFYLAQNPPFGAVITYRLKDGLETLQQKRRQKEKELFKDDQPVYYPSWDELRREDREQQPEVILTVKDAAGTVVRRLNGPSSGGLHRVAWDLRQADTYSPVELHRSGPSTPWDEVPAGPFAVPGEYSVTLSQRVRGQETVLAGPVSFTMELLGNNRQQTPDFAASVAFQEEAADLMRKVAAAGRLLGEAQGKVDHIRQAIKDTPTLDRALLDQVDALNEQLADLKVVMNGDRTISQHSEPVTPGIRSRIGSVLWGTRSITSAPTATHRKQMDIAARQFGPVLTRLTGILEQDIPALEAQLDRAGAPYTPGRLPKLD